MIGPFDSEDRRTTVRRFLPPHAEGQELIAKFINYFSGKQVDFDVLLPENVGTPFHRAVWKGLKQIPYGTYESFGDMAVRLGLPESRARLIGNSSGQNPLPIIYPCHRLIAPTGALSGKRPCWSWQG